MALYTVNWILPVAALVGCFLISTVSCVRNEQATPSKLLEGASFELDQTNKMHQDSGIVAAYLKARNENKALQAQLNTALQSREQLKKFFQDHKDHEGSINKFPLKFLAGMCNKSVDKCSPGVYFRIMKVESEIGIVQIANYARECRLEKLNAYCARNMDEVGRFLLENIDQDHKKLMKSLLRHYWEAKNDPDNTASDGMTKEKRERTDVASAYDELVHSEYGSGDIDIDQERKLLARVKDCVKEFIGIKELFNHISDGGKNKLVPKGDILMTEWKEVGKIAGHFYFSVHSVIARDIDERTPRVSQIEQLKQYLSTLKFW